MLNEEILAVLSRCDPKLEVYVWVRTFDVKIHDGLKVDRVYQEYVHKETGIVSEEPIPKDVLAETKICIEVVKRD